MKTADVILATSTQTDRAFNIGVVASTLAELGGLLLLYHFSVLSVTELVALGFVGVPVVAFVVSILLAHWLGYAAEARYRSLRYSMWLNDVSDQ